MAVFLVYFLTAAPGAWWGDGQELACAARTLGIPHPTGYPLYMLTGHGAMKLLPGLDPGRALTLFSALLLAVSIGMLIPFFDSLGARTASSASANAERTGASALPVIGAALLIAFARTVWEHATFAEVYPLTFFIGVLLLRTAWTPAGARPGAARAAVLGLVFGLGLLNHYSILALAPLVFFCLTRWSLHAPRRGWIIPLAAAAACALALTGTLYLPLRAAANPPLNWGDPSNWARLKWVLTGGQFKEIMLGATFAATRYGLANWLAWWGAQWTGVAWDRIVLRELSPAALSALIAAGALLAGSAAAGLALLARRRWELGLGLLGAFAATAAFAALYHIPDIAAYFMIALPAAMAGWIALIQYSAFRIPHSALFRALPALAALVLLLSGWGAVDKSWDDGPARYGQAVLTAAAPGALIVTSQGALGDAEIYALWYQQMVLGRRPDVTVYGSGFMFQEWYARYFERPGRPRIPVYIEPRPLGLDEIYFFVKFFRNVLLPNLAQGRQVLITYRHPLLSEYLAPRPAAAPLPPAYADACAFRYLPNPALYELRHNPRLAELDEKQLTAEFEAFARRRAAGVNF